MLYASDDTIVAISSAAGPAARGIVRVSGIGALELAAKVFHPTPSENSPQHSWSKCQGHCQLADDLTVAAKAYRFQAPRSYTGQDMLELHLPGSDALLQMLLERFLAQGCRLAEPGEFTARAFFNGRLDLSEAEAVGAGPL